MTQQQKDDLVVALVEAKLVGWKASYESDDDGQFNFDSPTLTLPRVRKLDMEEVCARAGLRCYKAGSGYWVIQGCSHGERSSRTTGAKAACKALSEAGYEAGIFYQLD